MGQVRRLRKKWPHTAQPSRGQMPQGLRTWVRSPTSMILTKKQVTELRLHDP